MADYSTRGNASISERGVILNYILPFIGGAIVATFFFEFVPHMIALAHDNIPWAEAFPKGFSQTIKPFEAFFTAPVKPSPMIFAWPVGGGALGIYLNRLYFNN